MCLSTLECGSSPTKNMPRIPIFKLGSSQDFPPPQLSSYTPALSLEALQLGIDNVRHDVWLSSEFTKVAGDHIAKLIAKYGNIQSLAQLEGTSGSKGMFSKFVPGAAKKAPDFKPVLLELHKAALNRAKAENNPLIDFLARASVIKFFRAELGAQYVKALERCRGTRKGYEGVRQQKALEYRETVASFQIAKKRILRQVGQELFRILREIEREALANMRRSLFGEQRDADYQLFLHQFIFLEESRDSYLAAEHYVLIGGFENDPDSFGNIRALACEFLKSAGLDNESTDESQLDGWLNAPENAHELVGTGEPSERAHKGRLQIWVELLEREKLLDLAIAAYEVVQLLPEFTPLLDPQQLKYALVIRKERDRVEKLIEEHGKLSRRSLESAAGRVAQCTGVPRAKIAARLLRDFMLYHRDLRRHEVLNRALEKVNLIANQKLRDLSSLNGTLYEFLLAEEAKDAQENPVVRHAILKADVRDSSRLTRSLLQRAGLPPLELGVGISFQDSSLMYLLDGDHRIMISDALNESDRLSSCDKRVRKAMEGMAVPFNVYEFRTAAPADADPMKYNVGGIRISEAAFNRLRSEISLEQCKLDFPRLWGSENIRYWSALVPVGADIFRRLLIRVSQAPVVETADMRLVRWTENPVYEVCTNPAVYTALEKTVAHTKS